MWRYYQHKPTVIRAIRWSSSVGLIAGMQPYNGQACNSRPDWHGAVQPAAVIPGLAGNHAVFEGDFVCRGERGELFPVPAEIFELNYEDKGGEPRGPIDDKMQAGIEDHVSGAINSVAGNV